MGGLLVFALFGLYLWLSYLLARRINPIWLKALTVVVLVLIPTADAVYGRVKLKQMCEAEGGLKIYRTAEEVEGFYIDRDPTMDWITKHGYIFIEGRLASGKLMRISRNQDGTTREEGNVTLRSRYTYELIGNRIGLGYSSEEQRIRDTRTNEILSRNINFSYEGGLVERFIASMYVTRAFAGACQEGVNRVWPDQIIQKTLIPSQK